MNIVYHHRTQGRGGEGVHIASLVRALEAEGCTVTIVSPPGVDPLRSAGCLPTDKGTVREQGVSRLWQLVSRHSPQLLFELLELAYNVRAWKVLAPQLAQTSPMVFYERYAFFLRAGVNAAKQAGLPVILEVNEVVGIKRARGQVLTEFGQRIERSVFTRADAIITVSSFLRERIIERGGREGAVHVVPNAVDAAWLNIPPGGEAIRCRLGLNGRAIVGFVGWFDRWDRLDLLIDVVARLATQAPQLVLLLVGDGPVSGSLREQAKRVGLADRVVLTGPVPRSEIVHYIDAMDLCVLPDSNPFGSPIVLFEFMGRGRAVVAPDLLPIRDVVEDEHTGLIVPPGNADALEEAVRRLIGDETLRARLGEAARRHVAERHTWTANSRFVARLATELLERTLGGGKR